MTLVNQQHRSGHGLPPVLTQGSACRESPEGSGASLAAFLCVLVSGLDSLSPEWRRNHQLEITRDSWGHTQISGEL